MSWIGRVTEDGDVVPAVGLNATLDGSSNALTFNPTRLGMQPAVYKNSDGDEVQTFDSIEKDAFARYDSLASEQQQTLTSRDVTRCAPATPATTPSDPGSPAPTSPTSNATCCWT